MFKAQLKVRIDIKANRYTDPHVFKAQLKDRIDSKANPSNFKYTFCLYQLKHFNVQEKILKFHN